MKSQPIPNTNQGYVRVRLWLVFDVSDVYSEWIEVKYGVPQGSVLGPILFNIFINDLFYVIEKSTLYNYADDNTMAHSKNNITDLNCELQTDVTNTTKWFDANGFKVNHDKFQCMAFGKLSDYIQFKVHETTIIPSKSVKILGIMIDDKLNFHEHVSDICKKAARQLNVLKRLHKHLNLDSRLAIFRCYILANFNYCPIVWHFCSIEQTRLIEKIQERALRFVYDDFTSPYEMLMKKGNHHSLYLGRLRNIALEVYKLLNDHSPSYIKDLITVKNSGYKLRNDIILNQPKCKTVTYGLNSFSYKGPKIWNNLPSHMKHAISLDEFKQMMKTLSGPNCLCNMCTKMLHST